MESNERVDETGRAGVPANARAAPSPQAPHAAALGQQAQQALRDSEARYRAIFLNVVDGIITIDDRGVIESANPAAERLFGYTAAEMAGRNVSMLMPSPYREEHDQYIGNYLRSGVPKIIGIGREVVGRRKDGTTFPMDLAVSEMWIGGRRMFTGLVRDVTERKAAQEALQQAKESAEAASHAKDHFLAVLSHELRTPLTPVLLGASSLASRCDLPVDVRQELHNILYNVQLESRLIDDLLDLTRIARGKLELHSQPSDVHELLQRALAICSQDVDAKELRVAMELRAPRHVVMADPPRLQQVFWNLLKNAVKFTPARGLVTIRTLAAGPRLRIEFQDTGIGIAPEMLPRLFNAFEQGERHVTRAYGGLGLGLAIAKALVERHGGAIRAHSAGRGQGATFEVELPTTTAATILPRPVSGLGREGLAGAAMPATRRLKILLVEDHESTAQILQRILRLFKHEVKTAGDVATARAMVQRERFDLVISDLGLPDGTGHDLMRYLRQLDGPPAIALSGYGTSEDKARSREAGFAEHLVKPVDVEQLRSAIERVMGTLRD